MVNAEKTRNIIDLCYVLNTDGEEWDIYQEAKKEISELERLAEIGRATEKAFEYGAIEVQNEIGIYDGVDELLEWHRKQEVQK